MDPDDLENSSASNARVTQGQKLRWRAFAALIILPALWMAVLAARYSVDVPYYDQWTGMAPLFEKMEAGTLGFHDFAAQHNEHRLPVPRLVSFAVDLLTHWNTRVEVFLTLMAFVGMAVSMWKLFEATGWRANSGFYALFAVLGLFIFDPLQDQNLTNGFHFHFVVALAFILTAFWAAVALRQPVNFIVTAALASAATFSMALGLGSWFLIYPLLFLRERMPGWKKWTVFWGIAFLLNGVVFLNGYKLALKPSASGFHIADTLHYFVVYLGAPFAWGTAFPRLDAAKVIGSVMAAGVVAAIAVVWTWRKDAALLRQAVPWLMVSCIGLMNGALTTMGRHHFGPLQAMETRYIPYAVTVPIGLLVIGALAYERSGRNGHAWTRPLLAALASTFLLLHFLSISARLYFWSFVRHDRSMLRAIVTMVDVVDPQLYARISPEPGRLRDSVHAMDRLGFLRPRPITTPSISAIADPAAPSDGRCGALEHFAQEGDRVAVTGWAILPERLEPADAVVLTYDDGSGVPAIFALLETLDDRSDIVRLTGEPDLLCSGWKHVFSTTLLPPGATTIRAWAYDSGRGRAWRLPGSAVVRRY